ncbi:hypothetical protein ACFQPA_20295 [Halomarina halobia]
MTSLHITDCADYETFARTWHAHSLEQHDVSLATACDRGLITEDETRLFWQLLGQLAPDELLFRLPEWLAEEKVGFVEGGHTDGVCWPDRAGDGQGDPRR